MFGRGDDVTRLVFTSIVWLISVQNVLSEVMSFSYEGLDGEIEHLPSQSDLDSGQSAFDPSRSTDTVISSNEEGGSYLEKLCDTKVSSKCSVIVRYRCFNSFNWLAQLPCNTFVKIIVEIMTFISNRKEKRYL